MMVWELMPTSGLELGLNLQSKGLKFQMNEDSKFLFCCQMLNGF